MTQEILLMSGGLDSVAAWYYLKKKPLLLYVDIQTEYTEKELKCLRAIKRIDKDFKFKVVKGINLGQFQKGKKAYILHRNLHLISIASNFGDVIYLVGIKDDNVSDKSEKAFMAMEHCLNFIEGENSYRISIKSPFWDWNKSRIVRWMLDNVENGEKLLRTSVSCYSKEKGQCGECPSCFRKFVAMKANKLDIKFFKKCPANTELAKEYFDIMSKDKTKYDEQRRKETLRVLKKYKQFQ